MLLETLDVKKNDILIYSENKFDFENNFKIIYKKASSKKPFNINFWEVGEYMNSPNPKNLILYRLLTNIPEFNASLTKYGIFIHINNSPEIVYYDPIFAVKELERLNGLIDFQSFRFKIHQIGLCSSISQNGIQNYREIYHFDLKAEEAKFQNDKVYAEAIFAFDADFKDSSEMIPSAAEMKAPSLNTYKPLHLVISEDKESSHKEMQKLDIFPEMNIAADTQKRKSFTGEVNTRISMEPEYNRRETTIGEFLKKQKQKVSGEQLPDANEDLLSLFKSADTYVSDRSSESIILRLKKSEE